MDMPDTGSSKDLIAETAAAQKIAARYQVSPAVHAQDFIFQFHLDKHQSRLPGALDAYFLDGDRSASRLDDLIGRFHRGGRRLSLLEFASGYGCVSRHLNKLSAKYDLVACDIHEAATTFLEEHLGIQALLSETNPDHLPVNRQFDVVFALSFFSHIPNTTFLRWIAKLFEFVADDGILIFTTHGRVGRREVGNPALEPEGYWFAPVSEQHDLSVQDYGTMITSPFYVFRALEQNALAKPTFFQEAFWWGTQDTYIVQKSVPADSILAQAGSLEARLHAIESEIMSLRLASLAAPK